MWQPQRETSKKAGHLPGNFENLLDRGAVFNEILPLTLHYRSPLVRGGLEISRQLTIKLSKGECAKALLHPTKRLYTKPITEEVHGYFLAIQDNFWKDEVETIAQATEKRKKLEKTPVRYMDISSMLGAIPIPSKLSQIPELVKIVAI